MADDKGRGYHIQLNVGDSMCIRVLMVATGEGSGTGRAVEEGGRCYASNLWLEEGRERESCHAVSDVMARWVQGRTQAEHWRGRVGANSQAVL